MMFFKKNAQPSDIGKVSLMQLSKSNMTISLETLIKNTYRVKSNEFCDEDNRAIFYMTLDNCLANSNTANSGKIIKLTLAFMSIGFSPKAKHHLPTPFKLVNTITQQGGELWFQKNYPSFDRDCFSHLNIAKHIMNKSLEKIESSHLQLAGYYFLRAAIYFEIQNSQGKLLQTQEGLKNIQELKNIMKEFDQLYNIKEEKHALYDPLYDVEEEEREWEERKLYVQLAEAMEDKDSSLYAALIKLPASSLKYLNQIKELTDYRPKTPVYEPPLDIELNSVLNYPVRNP